LASRCRSPGTGKRQRPAAASPPRGRPHLVLVLRPKTINGGPREKPAGRNAVRLAAGYATPRRESVGGAPVTLRNADVNELVSLKPTSSPISVTDSLRAVNRLLARSIRRLVR